MSGFLPANTTLQLGTNSGSINHQGILTSNINGTFKYSTVGKCLHCFSISLEYLLKNDLYIFLNNSVMIKSSKYNCNLL